MKSPQEGGCHACAGLTSQTLLFSLSCLGLIPIVVARWGELAGTETAGYLEDHYQLSYSEGRAEQFLLCCVAASGGLSEAQTENRICKWTCYKKQKQKDLDNGDPGNHHKAAFRDAIFPNQNLYHPVDGKLCIISRTGKRIVNPPADKWHNPRINKRPTQTVFWDQHTRATNKRVLGRKHLLKAKSEMIVTLSLDKVLKFFPTRLEIVLQEYNVPLELSINNLLAAVIGEPDPVPNERIIAEKRRRKPGFFFAMKTVNDEIRGLKGANLLFEIARECRNKGGLCFALVMNLSATSAFIFSILHGHKAQLQLRCRFDKTGEYFLLHGNNRRSKGKRGVIAVARKLSPNWFIIALHNKRYNTEEMEYYYLDKGDG
jgi:hypothetical protein